MDLDVIEACYDAIPRVAATVEEVGPFDLFVPRPNTGWDFYARPRLGMDTEFTASDVRRVLDRQAELEIPRAIEWVLEVTPTLLPAVRDAAVADVQLCPLLALTGPVEPGEDPGRCDPLGSDHPDLPETIGAVEAAFSGRDEVTPREAGLRPDLIASGDLVVVAAYDHDGRVVGGGSAAPRGTAAELMGIAVLPSARHQGHGAAITRALVDAVRRRGVETPYLSAASDDAAAIYRAVGFERVGTACIYQEPG